MEAAGRGVAEAVKERLGNVRARRIVLLIGPGNNGGDGLIAARELHDFGASVSVFILTPRAAEDRGIAALAARDVEIAGEDAPIASLADAISHADLIIDAVLGSGRQRPIGGRIAEALQALKAHRAPLVALDLPSGLNPDEGTVDPATVAADLTLTLGLSKIGLHIFPGSTYSGEVEVIDIGIPAALSESVATELLTASWARSRLPERPLNSNKGSFGGVLIVAGSSSYVGAACLASLGALRAGAGLVTLASVTAVRSAAASQIPEITHLPLPEEENDFAGDAASFVMEALPGYDAMIIGPGLGQGAAARALVRGVLTSESAQAVPAVIDADALNILARISGWTSLLKATAVFTPHPGELARLTSGTVANIQSSRLTTARSAASNWNQTVLLKGAHTVIARPDGKTLISPFANAALATAGTGDVLAGVIGGLLAQGLTPFDAAGLGVYLHGAAAELYAPEYGPSGMLASELGAGIARVAAGLRRGE
jgi:NAD(P)H-hydrate epimerase